MLNYFIIFKEGPLHYYYLEVQGTYEMALIREYLKEHFPLDWARILTSEEFLDWIEDNPAIKPLANVELGINATR